MQKPRLSVILWVLFALIFFSLESFFLYKISGRATPADGVRPFIVYILWWSATLMLYRLQHTLLARLLSTIIALSSFLITLFFIYYQRIDSFITGDDMVAILQSNPEEQVDFVVFNILTLKGLSLSILSALVALLLSEQMFRLSRRKTSQLGSLKRKVYYVLIVLFVLAGAIITSQLRPIKFYFMMREEYYKQIELFNKISSQVESVSKLDATKEKQGELYVLVMGESLNRDLMGCYNGFLDNTPFLTKLCEDPHTIKFANSYSAFVNTLPAITHAFSQGNFVTGLSFPYGENLFSVLKKANVKTAWISNQVRQSRFDTPIAAIADKTDFQYFSINLSEGSSKQQRPDEYILPQIKAYLDRESTSDNHLLVIHLMGSHSPYDNRYPDSINEYSFADPAIIGSSSSSMTVKRELNEYLTSIYYNDTVLEQIYNLVSSRDDFRGFIYLSDHAEEVTPPSGRHNMGQFTYTMTRIPLIINLDQKYVDDYPQSFNTLEQNKDKLFINDALYDLMLPLMQVKTSAYNKALAVSEPSYLEGIERGAIVEPKNVLEDPILIGAKNLKAFSSRVIIADPSCVFDAGLSMLYGAEAFKLDAVIEDDTLQVVLKGDDRKLSFEKFISSLPQEPKKVLLQVKLDEGQDKSVALKIVDELSKKYFKTQFWVNFAGSDLVENVGVNAVSSVRYQLVDCKSYSDFALSQPISEGGQRLIGVNCELGLQKTKLSKFFEQHPKLEWVLSEFVTDFDERK